MTLGLGVLVICLLLYGISLYGTKFNKIVWYVDIPSIITVVGILTALRLLSIKKITENDFVERCVFPIGIIVSVLNMIVMLNSTANNYLLSNLAVCILPILYSAIIYIVLQCLKNQKERK